MNTYMCRRTWKIKKLYSYSVYLLEQCLCIVSLKTVFFFFGSTLRERTLFVFFFFFVIFPNFYKLLPVLFFVSLNWFTACFTKFCLEIDFLWNFFFHVKYFNCFNNAVIFYCRLIFIDFFFVLFAYELFKCFKNNS